MASPTRPAQTRPVPSVEELDRLDQDAFARGVASLFEGAPRFLRRLAASRPFGSVERLFESARAVALTMPEDEQVELLDAHPRLGAQPGSVSALSYREQGYDRDAADSTATAERERVAADLDRLNEAYERRFGFRYCTFVAGRPRSALIPAFTAALVGDREDELRRGLEEVVLIAEDRYSRLAGRGERG